MRYLTTSLALMVFGFVSASAQVQVPSIAEAGYRHVGIAVEGGTYEQMGVKPITGGGNPYAERAVMIFDVASMPASFASCRIRIHATSEPGSVEMAMFPLDSAELSARLWDIDLARPVWHCGVLELAGNGQNQPMEFDVSGAVSSAIANASTHVGALFYVRTAVAGGSMSIYTHVGGPRPSLLFDGVVASDADSLGDLKTMFR